MDHQLSIERTKTDLLLDLPLVKQVVLLPNLLSLARVAMLPLLWFVVRSDPAGNLGQAILLAGLILITDAFDGFFAKKFNLRTRLGMILDPVCDKIVTIVILALMVTYYRFPLWFLLFVLARDLVILAANSITIARNRFIFRSGKFGRLAFVMLSVVMLVWLINWYVEGWFAVLLDPLLVLVILLMLVSSGQYISNFVKQWRAQNKTSH